MEGLLLAGAIRELQAARPFRRRGGWRFPAADTFILPLDDVSIMIHSRPPEPLLELSREAGRRPQDGARTRRAPSNFQQLLTARTPGELLAVEQLKLDRVLRFDFAGQEGFISTPPVSLYVELAGRNSNLILVDETGTILGAQREVPAGVSRYRQIQSGRKYEPPPPYEKADPRKITAPQLEELLAGRTLRELHTVLDGFGPKLARALAALSGVGLRKQLEAADLAAVSAALPELLADPARAVQATEGASGLEERLDAGRRAAALARLQPVLTRNRNLFERQLADLDKLRRAAAGASELRKQADLLLAYRPRPEDGQRTVQLLDFAGEPVEITLEPGRDAVATAELFYARARRRETRLEQALEREGELRQLLAEAGGQLDRLPSLPTERLLELVAELPAEKPGQQFRTLPGIRVTGPHGHTVIVGRNARENDQVTFGIARSRDVWLHVQGYRGSHVIIQAENREVPFDTIIFAAQLAAGHSQAADSSNVPVDYTLRKDVWKVRGGPAGAVHFTGQKTVYVTPVRRAEAEA